jgi:hypothetical protein
MLSVEFRLSISDLLVQWMNEISRDFFRAPFAGVHEPIDGADGCRNFRES